MRNDIREQSRLAHLNMVEWKKPRDDLRCDDLSVLPQFAPFKLPLTISTKQFNAVLCVSEFIHSFADMLAVKGIVAM